MGSTAFLIGIVSVTVLLAGCTSGGEAAKDVRAKDDKFEPNSVSLNENEKIKWTNDGANLHSVTIHKVGDAVTQTKKDTDIAAGTSTEFTFSEDGTFHVYCKYHSGGSAGTFNNGMVMTVTVKAK